MGRLLLRETPFKDLGLGSRPQAYYESFAGIAKWARNWLPPSVSFRFRSDQNSSKEVQFPDKWV